MSDPAPHRDPDRDPLAGLGPPVPVGRRGTLSALGAGAGLALFAVAIATLLPARAALEAIRGEGEVARILAAAPAEGSRARDRARALAEVDRAIAAAFEARKPRLRPAIEGSGSLAARLDALLAWGELRVEAARALAARGLTLEDVRAHAARRGPREADGLALGASPR